MPANRDPRALSVAPRAARYHSPANQLEVNLTLVAHCVIVIGTRKLLHAHYGSARLLPPMIEQGAATQAPNLQVGSANLAIGRATIAPSAQAAVPALVELLADQDPKVREVTSYALAQIGPAAQQAAPTLAKLLIDEDPKVREVASLALGQIGPGANEAVPGLVTLLNDPKAEVRRSAAGALAQIGPNARQAVSSLIVILTDNDANFRQAAAFALGKVGPPAKEAELTLVKLLADPDAGTRQSAAFAIGQIGAKADLAVPALIGLLADPSAQIRQAAADALAQVGAEAKQAVPALVKLLADGDPGPRQSAAYALARIGPAAKEAIHGLVPLLADPNATVRQSATYALAQIGPAAKSAVFEVTRLLRDPEPDVRRSAVYAIAQIGSSPPEAIPTLVELLKGSDTNVRLNAIIALAKIGPSAKEAVPALLNITSDLDAELRRNAVFALTQIGPPPQAILTQLKFLTDPNADTRRSAAENLGHIAASAAKIGSTEFIPVLSQAISVLEQTSDRELQDYLESLKNSKNELEYKTLLEFWKPLLVWFCMHRYALFGLMFLSVWIPTWYLVYRLAPLHFTSAVHWLKGAEIPLSGLGTIRLPAHWLILGWLWSRPHVIDAWLRRHLPTARERFARKRTVVEQAVHIRMPVELDGKLVPEFTGHVLREAFDRQFGVLLIWGEGGSGKTSLAFQIANWAMNEELALRPANHLMLPVFVGRNLDIDFGISSSQFVQSVHHELANPTDAEKLTSNDFVEALMRQRRLLIIVDHLSELSPITRDQLRLDRPNFPAKALILTSRLDEHLGGVHRTVLRPLRVTSDRLSPFMEAYLRHKGHRDLFSDSEFFEACARISDLIAGRAATLLLVKLYADQLIRVKEKSSAVPMPETIPDLMLRYLNDVNATIPGSDRREPRAVHRDAQAVAWACVRDTYRPAVASVENAVLPALATIDPGATDERLSYLENWLRLVETLPPGYSVTFLLDPLAEYLAAHHILRDFGANEDAWRGFLDKAGRQEGAPNSVRGFSSCGKGLLSLTWARTTRSRVCDS